MNESTTNRAPSPNRTWRIPRILLEDQLGLALLSWIGLSIAFAAIVIGVSFFRDIVISGWEVATGIIPWYAAFIGGYVLHTVLPVHVAHGRTRRGFAIEAVIFGLVFTTVLALLATAGYALEQGLYALNDWSRGDPEDHLFTSYTDYATIFAEYWLTVLVWSAAGAFVGAAIYRSSDLGWLSLVPALGLVGLAGITTDRSAQPMGFIMNRLPTIDSTSLALTAVISIICFLAALAMTWPVIRDVPLRNK